ncbi:MAG: hypothetical protein A2X48_23210 [Lentisphaerae bacterium GWF2_49_21]|nr:MAG: hypothetical protein A2X48_23210 [Lentisphaerae bacterium GWF2_49_21]
MKRFLIILLFFTAAWLHGQAGSFTVSTYNLNYGNFNQKLIKTAIEGAGSDIVALQETNKDVEGFLGKTFTKQYQSVSFTGNRGKHPGERFGFLSKYAFESLNFIKPKDGIFGSYVAITAINGIKLQIVNVHLQPTRLSKEKGLTENLALLAEADETHLKEIKNILDIIDKKLPTIVLGDFNSMSFFKTCNYMKENGYIDCVAGLSENPDMMHTWSWKLKNGYELPARIDFIFCNDAFVPKNMKIDKETGSDHFLMTVELEFKKSEKQGNEKK